MVGCGDNCPLVRRSITRVPDRICGKSASYIEFNDSTPLPLRKTIKQLGVGLHVVRGMTCHPLHVEFTRFIESVEAAVIRCC